MDMVDIITGLLHSSREGDFTFHIASIMALVQWCFTYNRLNYAQYIPFYYAQMSNISIDQPGMYDHFMQWGFSIQLLGLNTFGRTPVNQTIAETINNLKESMLSTEAFSSDSSGRW